MRIDRFLTVNVVQPFRRMGLAASDYRLPILMYHGISDEPEPSRLAYYQTNTSPAIFRKQIRYLAENSYRVVNLTRALEWLEQGGGLPEKSVVITFDDGFRNFYSEAFPVLREHGFTATVFLPTSLIQSSEPGFRDTEHLAWNEVREMRKCGIGFGSHTVSHPILFELSWKEIEKELRDSKVDLEQQLGESVTAFAYPYAFPQSNPRFVTAFRNLLIDAGYACCATTELGCARPGDDPYRLKRLPANSADDPGLYQAKLEGGYDWLALPQARIKRLKQQFRVFRKTRV